MTYVKWGDQVYWRHTDEPLSVEQNKKYPALQSSSSKRPEIELITQRSFKQADKIIEDVEKQEDKDYANRKKGAKKRAPKKKGWFS